MPQGRRTLNNTAVMHSICAWYPLLAEGDTVPGRFPSEALGALAVHLANTLWCSLPDHGSPGHWTNLQLSYLVIGA